jgi:uncharacterized protein
LKTRISVKVQSKASKTEYLGLHNGFLKIRVQAARERGAANAALQAFLSGRLRIPKASVTIKSGHTSNVKILEINGLDQATVIRRMNETP